MIYKLFKENGRIGTGIEETKLSLIELQDEPNSTANQTLLAAYDKDTNEIRIFNDKIIDTSSIILKFRNKCNLPNNYSFIINKS